MAIEYARSDALLREGFAIIGQYDAPLLAHMRNDTWRVSTDLDEILPGIPLEQWLLAFQSFGMTLSASCLPYGGESRTWINANAVQGWADANDVPRAMFAAHVLAHEYRHVAQECADDPNSREPDAFEAGSAFARKLPEPYASRMAAESDKDLRNVMAYHLA